QRYFNSELPDDDASSHDSDEGESFHDSDEDEPFHDSFGNILSRYTNSKSTSTSLLLAILAHLGLNLNVYGKDGKSTLSHSTYNLRLVCYLLYSAGICIDDKDANGRTALSYAAEEGYTKVVGLLLERGADASTRDNNGTSILSYA